ncbi:MAG: DNA polymerase III subunit beta, partial [Pseudolabrys sp.]|nr:DNA polymerase III subunit beta [Pseudolabrys sp.]
NARYLLDVLGQFDGENALLKLAEPGSPTLMLEREGAATLYVLMPMRV